MGSDEAGTLAQLKQLRAEIIERKITEHHGRIVKLTGDGMLAEFPSVVSVVACAVEMQRNIREQTGNFPPERRLEFRVGVNLGDVIVEGDDIYGDGVNVAARLESIAQPGGIAVSGSVRDHIGNRLDLAFEDRGEQQLKNIDKPIRVYDVRLEDSAMPAARHEGSNQARPSIAVLPFTNMSGDLDPDDPLTHYNVACGYTQLGDLDSALDMLERSIRAGGPELVKYAKHDSDLDPLRNHPRFQQLIERIG